ncbi:unnamed protein product [Protopolystoma xenopodis]|uniref:Uncharacterized protein n=1 Tax=Protopolystoma xenopodis TaxID=117903 RepID=A0A448WSX1_9PLAT|nr:unnamed protein product [Protopolystoma xenopodis]
MKHKQLRSRDYELSRAYFVPSLGLPWLPPVGEPTAPSARPVVQLNRYYPDQSEESALVDVVINKASPDKIEGHLHLSSRPANQISAPHPF